MTNALTAAPSPAVQEYFRSGNLAQLSDQEKDFVLAKLCERYGLDPLLRPFDLLNLSGKSVFYMNASALNQLAAQKDLSREITELAIDPVAMVAKCVCRVSAPAGRAETATAWISLACYRKVDPKLPPSRVLMEGEDFCNMLMKVEAKAKRRATMAFFGTPDYDPEARDTPAHVQVDPAKLAQDQQSIAVAPVVLVSPASVPDTEVKKPARKTKAAVEATVLVPENPAASIAAEYAPQQSAAIYIKGVPEHTGALRAQAGRIYGGNTWLNDQSKILLVQKVASEAHEKIAVLNADGSTHADFIALCEATLK